MDSKSGMNMLWIMLLSTMLIMGWTITTVQAHCAGQHTGDHPHCAGSEPPVTAMQQEIVTFQSAGKQRTKIVVTNADGSDPLDALVRERNVKFWNLSWSGDGSKILFLGEFNRQPGIFGYRFLS